MWWNVAVSVALTKMFAYYPKQKGGKTEKLLRRSVYLLCGCCGEGPNATVFRQDCAGCSLPLSSYEGTQAEFNKASLKIALSLWMEINCACGSDFYTVTKRLADNIADYF